MCIVIVFYFVILFFSLSFFSRIQASIFTLMGAPIKAREQLALVFKGKEESTPELIEIAKLIDGNWSDYPHPGLF
jgi:hypothetical protein